MNPTVFSSLGLDWLVRLRWLAAGGQLALLVFALFYLQIELPLGPLSTLVGVLVLSNVLLYLSVKKRFRIPSSIIGATLVLDTLLLTLLLYWTGGPNNPFSALYLVHVALAAIVLGTAWTWALTGLSSLFFGLLFIYHVPLALDVHGGQHSAHHVTGDSHSLHLYGMLIAFVFTASLMAYFLTQLTKKLRKTESEVHQLQLKQINDQRLASLATLSAGAAHELSTPLSTIAVIANEFERELGFLEKVPDNLLEDARLIGNEVRRCKEIIDKIGAQSGSMRGETPLSITIQKFIVELEKSLSNVPKNCWSVKVENPLEELEVPVLGLRQSIVALLRNAVDATSGEGPVDLHILKENDRLFFRVSDRGVGMKPEVVSRIGEPFFSTKEAGKGMGLGFYLAKLFAESWGGSLSVESKFGKGTIVTLSIPEKYGHSNIKEKLKRA